MRYRGNKIGSDKQTNACGQTAENKMLSSPLSDGEGITTSLSRSPMSTQYPRTDRQTDGHRTIANEALAQRRGWYYYNVSALACHNFDLHQPILIISGRNVAKTVEVK